MSFASALALRGAVGTLAGSRHSRVAAPIAAIGSPCAGVAASAPRARRTAALLLLVLVLAAPILSLRADGG